MREFVGASLVATLWLIGGLLIGESIKVHAETAGGKAEVYVLGMQLADFLMVALTFAIVFFTGGLLLEEKDRSRKELRAYLGAVPHDVAFVGDNWIQAHVDIENTGSTPARDVVHWTDWDIRTPTGNNDFPLREEPGFGKRPIAPGGKWTLGFERQLTPQELAGLQMRQTALFVWGRIEYRDIYGQVQWLTFRFQNIGVVWMTDQSGERKHVGWSLYASPDGNEAS